MEATKLRVADVDLEVVECGRGRPLLFLHGGGGFEARQPFAVPLSAKRPTDRPLASGFGKSGLPDWLDSVDDIAHLYLELMDQLDLRDLDVVGCSIGGWIAAEMATKSLERIRWLVLVSPVGHIRTINCRSTLTFADTCK